jgi:hypothetical protein
MERIRAKLNGERNAALAGCPRALAIAGGR